MDDSSTIVSWFSICIRIVNVPGTDNTTTCKANPDISSLADVTYIDDIIANFIVNDNTDIHIFGDACIVDGTYNAVNETTDIHIFGNACITSVVLASLIALVSLLLQ